MTLAMALMLAGCGGGPSPAEAGEGQTSSPSPSASAPVAETQELQDKPSGTPAYYAAYREIVADYQERYRIGTVQQTENEFDRMTSLMGLCIVRLLDFDKDGTEELLLIWAESDEQYHSYRYGIWTSPDGRTTKSVCEYPILDGIQGYGPFIELVERADGIYIGQDFDLADADSAHVYRKITANGASDALTLAYIPPFGQDEEMLVNGQTVSDYDAYLKAGEDFLAGAEVTRIDLTSWSVLEPFVDPVMSGDGSTADEEEHYFRAFLRDTQNVIAILEGKEQADKYRFEWREADTYTSYGEVVSTYLAGYGEPHIRPSSRYDDGDDMPALAGCA